MPFRSLQRCQTHCPGQKWDQRGSRQTKHHLLLTQNVLVCLHHFHSFPSKESFRFSADHLKAWSILSRVQVTPWSVTHAPAPSRTKILSNTGRCRSSVGALKLQKKGETWRGIETPLSATQEGVSMCRSHARLWTCGQHLQVFLRIAVVRFRSKRMDCGKGNYCKIE